MGGFWLDLKGCKSGRLMVATEFSRTKTQRTVTMRVTESVKESSKTETIAEAESIPKNKSQTKQRADMEVEEQLHVPPVGKVDQTEREEAESKEQPTKETAASWKDDDDDGAQALKALLLKDQKEGAINSETFKEGTNMEGKIQGAEKQKNEQGNIED